MTKTSLFEVMSVIHEREFIYFNWTDIDGMYKVYRDGELFYEGTVAEFTDWQIEQGRLYEYTIERMMNEMVKDVVVIQTTALSERKAIQNPLKLLVQTVIVASSQLVISWEKIPGVQEYHIFRNGEFVRKTTENCIIDRQFSKDMSYLYEVKAERPVAKSAETFNIGKSFLANTIGLLTTPKKHQQPAIEQFQLAKKIAPARLLLVSVVERAMRKKHHILSFRYMTFLQEDYVRNVNYLSRNCYFKGDDRSFDPEGDTYRTRVTLELDQQRQAFLSWKKEIGQTVAYNLLKSTRAVGRASSDGIQLQRFKENEKMHGFLLTHHVGNPLVAAPTIDYEVEVLCYDGRALDITGFHDRAPHHEVYIKRDNRHWIPVHQEKSAGLVWMADATGWCYWRYSTLE